MAALNPIVGVSIQIVNIHNVDLFFQGLYHVTLRLREDRAQTQPSYAVPHLYRMQSEADVRPDVERKLPLAAVVDNDGIPTFRSRTAIVRYCDEDIPLQDAADYRIERRGSDNTPLIIEASLMFADVTPFGGLDCYDPECPMQMASPRVDVDIRHEFQTVSTQKIRIHGGVSGLHSYCPLVFGELHFCQVGLVVHAVALDYRLRRSLDVCAVADSATPLRSRASCSPNDDVSGTVSAAPKVSSPLTTPLDVALTDLAKRTLVGSMALDHSADLDILDGNLVAVVDKLEAEYSRRLMSSHGELAGFLAGAANEYLAESNSNCGRATSRPFPAWARPVELQSPDDGTAVDDSVGAGSTARLMRSLVTAINHVSAQVLQMWQQLLTATACAPSTISWMLHDEWLDKSFMHWSESIFRSVQPGSEMTLPSDRSTWKTHEKIANALRSSDQYRKMPCMLLEDTSTTIAPEVHPVMFIQRYSSQVSKAPEGKDQALVLVVTEACGSKRSCEIVANLHWTGYIVKLAIHWALQVPITEQLLLLDGQQLQDDVELQSVLSQATWAPRCYRGYKILDNVAISLAQVLPTSRVLGNAAHEDETHVVVLSHGFQGNSFDMRLLKDNIALLHPKALFLCATCNEDDTECDISVMGKKLAAEVRTFIKDTCIVMRAKPTRLSFVAHSVGGLIIRSALPHLQEEYGSIFYSFVSLSSPHLGYIYSANSLFKTGLWVAKKWRKSTCLEQLSMTDQEDPRECFMYTLACQDGLRSFQHVVLISSYQDKYAPYESARIEEACVAEADEKMGPIYAEMVRAALKSVQPERLIRVDFNFEIPETNLDTVIGRAAHIQLIENQTLMRMFTHSHKFLFDSSDI